MFRRKKEDGDEMKSSDPVITPPPMAEEPPMLDTSTSRPSARGFAPGPAASSVGGAFGKPVTPMAPRSGSSWGARDQQRPSAEPATAESKKLLVGRDIVLSGQITSCERLIVEGRVEASLTDSRLVELAESGHFKGSAEIESADIAGRFEGTLTVRERLFVRSTGKVTGKITYGQIEIEPGGEISGEVHVGARPPNSD
jgi:cytoskeletal protein CcmA (bactofilin family)